MNSEHEELDGLLTFDTEAISAIHQRYFPQIFRYVRFRLGDEILAEDIAGETLTRLLEAVSAGNGPRTTLRGWLMGTASNLVNDHLRQRYHQPQDRLSDALESQSHADDPSHHSELADRNRAIRHALAQLTPEQQQVISLRFGCDYSLEETAMLMNKKTNAIKALQFRALAALKRLFVDEYK
jgi:RNA polymerase sigma-70 factor (ECF subfamily)